ncbi:MAG TPA: hypothetical protein VLE91_04485 [Candidatus Saccharimonadales bacterium]|nr:hypothetical protein [Candidatus Saccharimonadales bacterium]
MPVYNDNFIQGIDGHPEVHLKTDEEGNSVFGKTASVQDYKVDWKSPWKELFNLKFYKYAGIVDLSPSIRVQNGMLIIQRSDIPFNWSRKIENPSLIIKDQEIFFSTLLACDVSVKHQNRAKGKNEHIGLLPINESTFLGAPIDNEISLDDLQSEITGEWIEAFFAADFIKNRESIEKVLERIKSIPVLSIAAETTQELLSVGNFSNDLSEEIQEFSSKTAFQVKERIPKAVDAILNWFDNKFQNMNLIAEQEQIQGEIAK